ncbi:MAG: hypothetical protein C0518_04130 [Opitutus sp.]|nr:hypothetical protein [Opitutus sp.]
MFVNAPRIARTAREWLSFPLGWVVVPLLCFVALFCIHLWPEWSTNPDLSHGFFAPVVFALLLWEGTKTGTPRWLKASRLLWLAIAILLVGALAMLALAGLLAASVGWSHAAVNFALALVFTAALAAGVLVLASEPVRAVPFNWTILTAVVLWLLAAPLPAGTYARIMLTLQGAVTSWVLNSLHVLGIPARQSGNIIELATTSVGVEEACSGIRSLISCLYAGLFFAAWLVRSPARRAVLILAAPVMAIGMNFLRSLALTLMANRGIDITGFWHDATGYAILGVTALGLAGMAALLGPRGAPVNSAVVPASDSPASRTGVAIFATGSAMLVALGCTFAYLSRSPEPLASTTPEVAVESLLPAQPPGWQVVTAPDLYRFSGILQTEHLVERTYFRASPSRPVQLNVYVAHWIAGAAPVSLVASHTPDACWPGAGWVSEPTPDRQVILETGGRKLPVGEHRRFTHGAAPQHVWFWHIYNGRVINYRDPYSISALVEIALAYGFRREGPQYFVRVSSNVPWEQLHDEPLVREIFNHLDRVGLRP